MVIDGIQAFQIVVCQRATDDPLHLLIKVLKVRLPLQGIGQVLQIGRASCRERV